MKCCFFGWRRRSAMNTVRPFPRPNAFWRKSDAISLSAPCSQHLTKLSGASQSLNVSMPKRGTAITPIRAAMWIRRFNMRHLRERHYQTKRNLLKSEQAGMSSERFLGSFQSRAATKSFRSLHASVTLAFGEQRLLRHSHGYFGSEWSLGS